jgi:hypothetical protein
MSLAFLLQTLCCAWCFWFLLTVSAAADQRLTLPMILAYLLGTFLLCFVVCRKV